MLCPCCEIALVSSERHGVEIDYCPQCHGVWLARGALDKIIDRAYDEPFEADRHGLSDSRLAYLDRSRSITDAFDTSA